VREQRLSRITGLLGKDKIDRLGQCNVAVVGLGAVGGFCLEALVRSGIGRFTIVDFDRFEPSNLNRQILALESTLGKSKAEVAAQRIKDIAPEVEVTVIDAKCSADNVDEIVDGKDLVVDAIDDVQAKCLLLKTCCEKKIPVVSSMGAARKTDPSRIRVTDLTKTHTCPLAKQVRTRLGKEGVGKGITVVFSDEEPRDLNPNGSLGSMPTVTGMFGLRLAHTAIEKLLENFTENS